ncbi:hypothetical protein VFPBJ_11749 [Purpureocillium lilacinum]|uniref:Uncharacterized protein n=1 Tax=Purpureocillium lilacinum TaxID=33203 RepID=A0A179EW75_PURLI|nr:hypothetical protein VFPBJ_11749 [Purpureocillium lilacinum]
MVPSFERFGRTLSSFLLCNRVGSFATRGCGVERDSVLSSLGSNEQSEYQPWAMILLYGRSPEWDESTGTTFRNLASEGALMWSIWVMRSLQTWFSHPFSPPPELWCRLVSGTGCESTNRISSRGCTSEGMPV